MFEFLPKHTTFFVCPSTIEFLSISYSVAQFNPDSLRTSAAIMFAERKIQPFHSPKPGQRIQRTPHGGDVTFDALKLWHEIIAVENGGKKFCQIRCDSAHKAQKGLTKPCSFGYWNLLVFSFFSSGLFNKTIQFLSGTVCVASVLFWTGFRFFVNFSVMFIHVEKLLLVELPDGLIARM